MEWVPAHHEAKHVWVVQAHHGELRPDTRDVTGGEGPDVVAVDHGDLLPRHHVAAVDHAVHPERPRGDGEGTAGARARGGARAAAAAAGGRHGRT